LFAALEVFFPRATSNKWRFPFDIVEIVPGQQADIIGHVVVTTEVIHQSGAPSTAVRIGDGERVFAYSGDTEWTDALISVAADSDLFIVECYAYQGRFPGHLSWEILQQHLPQLRARRIMVTHMNATMLEHRHKVVSAGLMAARDGDVIEF
jgi:ribonuclease BN (tRNA processing enzyme)